MTTTNIIARPKDTNVSNYVATKESIYAFRKKNPEYIKEYNREYQRKLRSDPEQYYLLQMRIRVRQYLTSEVRDSQPMKDLLGISRADLAAKYNLTEKEFIAMIKKNTVDAIVGYSWIKKNQYHLFPYLFRWYNIQFISKKQNQKNHAYVDEKNKAIESIVKQMNAEYVKSL